MLDIDVVIGKGVIGPIVIRHRLHIVNAAPVVVVAVAEHQAKLLSLAAVRSEPETCRRIDLKGFAAVVDRRIAVDALNHERRPIGGRLLDPQVHRSADCIAILAGGERLVDDDRSDKVRWNCVQVHLSHRRVGSRHNHPIDGGVAQAWLRSADLHILPFALVALQGYAGHAAESVGNVGVGQALNLRVGLNIENVVRNPLLIDGRSVALQVGGDLDPLVGRGDVQDDILRSHLPCSDGDSARSGGKSHVGDCDGIAAWVQICDQVSALGIGDHRRGRGLQHNLRAREDGAGRIFHRAADAAAASGGSLIRGSSGVCERDKDQKKEQDG